MERVSVKPQNSGAIRRWARSTARVLGGCCLITVVMLTACAGGAEAAGIRNRSMSRRHNRMLTSDGGEMGKREKKNWSNFTRGVFRVGGGGGQQQARWPELKLDTRSELAMLFGGIGASLTTAAGLGGGGLFVPLFNLLLLFDSKTSAALSNFVMVGGQSITMVVNLAQSHPVHPERPLIDFDVALLLQPNLLLGISMGVILNILFPNWLITLLLTVVLFYMTLYSCKSGLKRWKKESKLMALPSEESLSNHTAIEENVTQSSSRSSESSQDLMEGLIERHSFSRFPVSKIMALAIIWLAFGSVHFVQGKKKCGLRYWLLTASQIPLALIVTHFIVEKLRDSAATTKRASDSSGSCPVSSWDDAFVLGPEASSHFPKMALITGILGGMIGIAGAVIINPMLTSAGMHPQVTAATSGSMVVFSASMSVVQYWLMGRVPLDWALTSAALAAFFSALGVLLVQRLISVSGRASLVVFLVAFVLGISALLMAVLGGWDVWEQLHTAAGHMSFHYHC